MRYRAVLAYDGGAYHGFQRQENAEPTIQSVIEVALKQIAQAAVTVLGAGRTDAGVHAAGQVIAFDLDWRHSPGDLQNALNAVLPVDMAVRALSEAAPVFHPRFDALRRSYEYRLYVSPVRDPFSRRYAWHRIGALDVSAIRRAAGYLLGEHDFSTFGSPPQGDNPVRTVYVASWNAGQDNRHTFTITANAFLYRMVRSIVGTLVQVGQQRVSAQEFREILASCDRSQSGPVDIGRIYRLKSRERRD
jgi:tRNA pseudouridine38-40 synthase